MANRVTKEDIIKMNELYCTLKTYAAVARATGFSASTVSKYIDKSYKPKAQIVEKKFTLADLPEPDYSILRSTVNWGDLCKLSDEEYEEIKQLWEEIQI